MKPNLSFCVSVGWPERRQAPADLAPRFVEMMRRLQAIDPMFAIWRIKPFKSEIRPLVLAIEAVTNAIEAGVGRDDDGNPEPRDGYLINAVNQLSDVAGPRSFNLTFRAHTAWKAASSCVSLATAFGVVPAPNAVTFEVFKGALLALSEPFAASHADAWPSSLTDFWKRGRDMPHLPISWISYVGPRYAPLVTPPASAIVERRTDGGLLMAATDETFSVDNPTHMAVARDIEAAVAPFNALPRPLEDVAAR